MKIIRDCREIVFVYLLQLMLVVIVSFICSVFNYDVVKFISNQYYYIILVFYIVLSYFLIKKYSRVEKRICFDNVFVSVYFILSLAIFLNMLFFLFNMQNKSDLNINIFLLVISSCILGPIVEEYLFRNILLNRLLDRYSVSKAIMIESFIFALFHNSMNGFLYALVIGICLSIIYVKFRNIKIPILCHMLSNFIILFLFRFNLYILILSGICLLICAIIFLRREL